MSHSLNLSPLPSVRSQEDSNALFLEREGFVDEEAVSALVAQPFHTRTVPSPHDFVLTLDDMDYAGWHNASPTAVKRTAEVPPQVINAIVRHSAPPARLEFNPKAPAPDDTRWWLAAVGGVFTALLASAIFVGVSPGPRKALENFFTNAAAVLSPTDPASLPQAEEVFEP